MSGSKSSVSFRASAELVALTRKTLGVMPVLQEALAPLLPKLQAAWVYGSVAKQTDTARSDIDVMLIGDISFRQAVELLHPTQAVLGREVNPKFGQKLDFLGRMTKWADTLDKPTLIVGDFTSAPLESDVWSHKQLLKVVSHTPIEVETLGKFRDAHGWVDLGRQHIPAPARYYSWWSYRNPAWQENDKGRRLDHMWASPELARQATAHRVLEDARSWTQPSDHVPLITEFDL